MTKPLQGALFKKFRDQIMGVVPAQEPGPGKAKPSSGKQDSKVMIQMKQKRKKLKIGLALNGRRHRSVLGDSVKDSRMKDGQHVPQKLFRGKRGTRERTRNIDTLHMSSRQNAHELESHGPKKGRAT